MLIARGIEGHGEFRKRMNFKTPGELRCSHISNEKNGRMDLHETRRFLMISV